MKKLIVVFCIAIFFTGCKSESKSDATEVSDSSAKEKEQKTKNIGGKTEKQANGLIAVQGSFIYYADAAVLQTPSRMFGVVINDKMHELDKQVQAYKNEPTDMVPVTVRGRMFKKPENEEGWEDRIDIVEILKVTPPDPEDNEIIRVGGDKARPSN